MPKVICDACDTKTEVPAMYLGKMVKCPKCRSEFKASLERPSPKAKPPARNEATKPIPTPPLGQKQSQTIRVAAVAVAIALMVGAFVVGEWYGRRSVADEYQSAMAEMKRAAQQTRLPVVSSPAAERPAEHQQTVEEMMDADPLISQLAESSVMIKYKIMRGEYPDNEVGAMILMGKMTPSDAEHVRDFCESVRRHGQ